MGRLHAQVSSKPKPKEVYRKEKYNTQKKDLKKVVPLIGIFFNPSFQRERRAKYISRKR